MKELGINNYTKSEIPFQEGSFFEKCLPEIKDYKSISRASVNFPRFVLPKLRTHFVRQGHLSRGLLAGRNHVGGRGAGQASGGGTRPGVRIPAYGASRREVAHRASVQRNVQRAKK